MTDRDNSLIKHVASAIDIKFPDNDSLIESEKTSIENSIKTGGIVTTEGKLFIDKDKLPPLLGTDKKGVNKFYNDLDDDDKFIDGSKRYADSTAVSKEQNKRIQEPRSQLEREKLKHSRDCVNAFIDAPQLEKERTIESDRIQKRLPNLTKEKIKADNITADQLTGERFENDAEGHHIERKADNPRKATDLDNIVVIKKSTHKEIHDNNAEDKQSLIDLANNKGWNENNIK
ncbi:MAG: hypothetical protein ATN35_06630 [Epulopiscium sp. Nele67-Bin004]|nr:MAG: hypothetical protein ATN35_06630 [Epulopiscium sp. Nele67-Bin004]